MHFRKIILPFLAIYVIIGESANFDAQYKLMEKFLTIRNLNNVVLYTCWSFTNRVKIMKKFNEKQIAVTYRNIKDFDGNYNLKDVFTISLYSPLLGVIVDWTCDEHEDMLFKFSDSWLWNSSYHWLMVMDKYSNIDIQNFLSSNNINLTVGSELLLAYPDEIDEIMINWRIFDIYRTAFEPRGQLMIDALNATFGKWGNRLWKFDKRSNLQNLSLNAVSVTNSYGSLTKTNGTYINQSSEDLVKYLRTFNIDRLNSYEKFSYAVIYPLTRFILNITMVVKTANSWGFKNNKTWDGVIGKLMTGEADISMTLHAFRTERFEAAEYSGVSNWRHQPCFIFRHPRSSTASLNIFLRPFEITVWFSIIGVIILSAFVYYTIIHFESKQMISLSVLSDIFLLKIGTLCQQGTTLDPKKFSNRLIIILMFVFSLVMYQFYSSSIVSNLLRPTVMHIDSIKKLEESGLDVGVEDLNIFTRIIHTYGDINPYMKKIITKKIKPKSEYFLAKDGVKKIKKGYYAFFTDPAISYWLINDIFTEREKCDLSELPLNRPESTGFLVQKHSPYKKLINYACNVLFETGLMERERRILYAKKPECVSGKTITEESLVSVGIKDIVSLLVFLLIGFIISLVVLILEIIIFRYNTEM